MYAIGLPTALFAALVDEADRRDVSVETLAADILRRSWPLATGRSIGRSVSTAHTALARQVLADEQRRALRSRCDMRKPQRRRAAGGELP
jgi:hypothetical protein